MNSTVTASNPSPFQRIILLLGVLWLLCWLYVKYELYWGLQYASDLFLHLQISKSFYWGRGLFYDNIFAPHSYIHSYFVLLLLAPFTFSLGAFGLPVAYLTVVLGAWSSLWQKARHDYFMVGVLAAILFGPIGFWIFDDPAYGFHAELLFFPFSILFALALQRQSRLTWLWAALLVLNREDGPIIGCAVHSLYHLTQSPWTRPRLWKLGKLVLSWIAIFCVGMLVLKTFGSGANSRQGKVLAMFWQILEQPELFAALSDMLRGTLFLLLPGLGLLLCRSSRVALLGLLLTALPVLAVTTLASFAYLPSVEAFLVHGTSWPYRFGMLWGLVGAALIFSPRTALGKSPFLCFVMVLLSFVGQYYMLNSVRNYNVIQRTLTARQPSNQLSIKEKVVLNCLKAILPSKTAVMTSGPFTAYFSHLDWSYGGNNAHAKMQAEVIVCDKGKFGFNFLCREELAARPESDWVKKEVHGLQIGFRKDNKKINRFVRACL